MTQKNKTDYLGLTVILIIFIIVIIGGVVLHEQNRSMRKEIKQQKEQLAALRQKLQSIEDSNTQNVIAETPVVDKYNLDFTPDHEHQTVFIAELEKLASDNHLKMAKPELKTASLAIKNNPNYQISQWQIALSGDYQGLVGFLDALSRSGRLVMVSKFKMSSEYLNGNKYQLNTLLTLDLISNAVSIK